MKKIFYLIPLAIVLFFAYGIITNIEKTNSKKKKRVSCQEKTITFEKISNKNLAKDAITLLKTGNYTIKSRIEKSKYMKSQILNHITIDKANSFFENSIKPYLKELKNLDKKVLIDYYIYENDKEDKGKKSSKAKLYAGYLVVEFKLDKKQIYKIQTDYMKMDTSDIPERMDCVVQSFITIEE